MENIQVSETGLAIVEKHDALSINRAPDVVLDEARKAAVALTDVIEKKSHKVVFNKQTYLQFEDWQTLGRFYGVTAMTRETKYVEYGEGDEKVAGFEARAEALLVGTNQVISSAEAMCLKDEPNWARKPMFQLKSMAQTRACAKALRNVLAWVVVLAGYAPTPAEEMEDAGPLVQPPRRKSAGVSVMPHSDNADMPSMDDLNAAFDDGVKTQQATQSHGRTISDKQQKRLYAISKSHNWNVDDVKSLLGRYGFEHSKEVTTDQYEAICTELEAR